VKAAGARGVLLLALGLGELALFVALLVTSGEENCDNGVARWACSDSLQTVVSVALVVVPLAAVAVYWGWRPPRSPR
jgi:hypothetical protein